MTEAAPSSGATTRDPLAKLLIGLVRAYQLVVSPWLAPRCRYYPSCSAYAITALRVHGPIKGLALAVWRVLRCNPWSLGGVDHVPPRRTAGGDHALTGSAGVTEVENSAGDGQAPADLRVPGGREAAPID